MKHLLLAFCLSFFVFFSAFSQEEQIHLEALNNYKYIIVPKKYDFLKDADKYQINSLTKFLFNKYGYTALFEDDTFPEDLANDRCLALKVDVEKIKKSFLSIKLKINLRDCNDILISRSKEGKSREKEFKTAYNLALREAFETYQFYSYKYVPNEESQEIKSDKTIVETETEASKVKEAQQEIEQLKQELEALKEEKAVETAKVEPDIEMSPSNTSISQSIDLKADAKLLYAQPIDKGFQVVDSTPKVVMILLETPKENIFIVKDQNAMVYKEDGFWYISKYEGETSSLERLSIKF